MMTNVTTNDHAIVDDDRQDLLDEQVEVARLDETTTARRGRDRGLKAASAKKPSSSEPTRPPTRCTPTTSSESS